MKKVEVTDKSLMKTMQEVHARFSGLNERENALIILFCSAVLADLFGEPEDMKNGNMISIPTDKIPTLLELMEMLF